MAIGGKPKPNGATYKVADHDILVVLKTCAGVSKYMFPARYDGDQCMSVGTLNRVTLMIPEQACEKHLPLEPYTVHDLRLTGSSLHNEVGFNRDWIEKALAHEDAVPSACLIEALPDLVGLTDVADIVGVSRQAMRKLMLAHRGTFPMPVHEGSASIWHLAEVLDWLAARGGYQIDTGILEIAQVALEVNITKEAVRHPISRRGNMQLLTA